MSMLFSFIYPFGFLLEWWNLNVTFFVASIIIWTIIIALDNAHKGDKRDMIITMHQQNLIILEIKKDTDMRIEQLKDELKKLKK